MYRGRVFAGVTAALVLLVAACGDDGDDTAYVENVSSQDGDEAGDQSGTDGGDNRDGRDGDVTAGADGPIDATPGDEVLASVSGEVTRGINREGRVELRVDVMGMQRSDDLVDLTMIVTNDDEANDYAPYNHEWSEDSFKLVDQGAQRVYLPVVDSNGDCLCNTFANVMELGPGESVTLYARFGGIPDDVSALDVQSDYFAPVVGVPVSG